MGAACDACAKTIARHAKQPIEDLVPFRPAEAPDTSLQKAASQASAMEIRGVEVTEVQGALIDLRVNPCIAPRDLQCAKPPGKLEREPKRLRMQRQVTLALHPWRGFDSPLTQIKTNGGVQIDDVEIDGTVDLLRRQAVVLAQ
jgi:hypothetical protein